MCIYDYYTRKSRMSQLERYLNSVSTVSKPIQALPSYRVYRPVNRAKGFTCWNGVNRANKVQKHLHDIRLYFSCTGAVFIYLYSVYTPGLALREIGYRRINHNVY